MTINSSWKLPSCLEIADEEGRLLQPFSEATFPITFYLANFIDASVPIFSLF